MDAIKKEIRRALLGDLVPDDKRLAVSGQGRVIYRNGLRDGFGSVFFFGVFRLRQWYYIDKKCKNFKDKAQKTMQNMGRMLNLKELSNGDAVYITYFIGIPSVLTYSLENDKLSVSAYSGRSLFGLISASRALITFGHALEGEINRFSSDSEKQLKNTEKQEAKKKQAEEKAAKKNEKKDKKKKDINKA